MSKKHNFKRPKNQPSIAIFLDKTKKKCISEKISKEIEKIDLPLDRNATGRKYKGVNKNEITLEKKDTIKRMFHERVE